MICLLVTTIGHEVIGVQPNQVGTCSIRTAFALLINLNGAQDNLIHLKEQWHNNSYLQYMHGYMDNFGDMAGTLFPM